jgi:hypothetical protein
MAEEVQAQIRKGQLDLAIAQLVKSQITYLVWPAGKELRHTGLEKFYEDRYYQVYLVSAAYRF